MTAGTERRPPAATDGREREGRKRHGRDDAGGRCRAPGDKGLPKETQP